MLSYLEKICVHLARTTSKLIGWHRGFASLCLGIISTAALPPVHAFPLLFLSFSGLLWLLSGTQTRKAAFFEGWCFGFGHFGGGLYWISISLFVDLRFAWLIPFSALGIPAILGLYTGLGVLITYCVGNLCWRVLTLAVTWTLFEWFRGILFTGFPWNPIGIVWAFSDFSIQAVSVFGVLGLGFVTVLSAAIPTILAYRTIKYRRGIFTTAMVLIGLLFLSGFVRLSNAPNTLVNASEFLFRAVQPNIAQRLKWKPELVDQHLARLMNLSNQNTQNSPALVIWPETAVAFIPEHDIKRRSHMASILHEKSFLISGSLRTTVDSLQTHKVWNSLHVINDKAEIVATYDKYRLVPFGEYVPLVEFLGLQKFIPGPSNFSAGSGPSTVKLKNLPPFSPLICYEVIFPNKITAEKNHPKWILNLTNDSWFGNSSGPYQHFAMAKVRAIEQGVPLVRVANTGISGVFDGYGRVIKKLGLNEEGFIDFNLPKPNSNKPFFVQVGETPVIAILFLTLALIFIFKRH